MHCGSKVTLTNAYHSLSRSGQESALIKNHDVVSQTT